MLEWITLGLEGTYRLGRVPFKHGRVPPRLEPVRQLTVEGPSVNTALLGTGLTFFTEKIDSLAVIMEH